MSYSLIITHPGQFHADELCAIALLIATGLATTSTPILRRNPTEPELADPSICILDIGKQHDAANSNFDHHHDGKLPATNMLVLNLVTDMSLISLKVAAKLQPFMQEISDIDTGRINPANIMRSNLSSMITAFNTYTDGFSRALDFILTAVLAQIATAEKAVADEQRWDALKRIETVTGNHIAVQHDTDLIVGWKELAYRDGVLVLICPNREAGQYSIIVRNSDELTVPVHPEQTFRHHTGFMAVYPSFKDALKHAKEFA